MRSSILVVNTLQACQSNFVFFLIDLRFGHTKVNSQRDHVDQRYPVNDRVHVQPEPRLGFVLAFTSHYARWCRRDGQKKTEKIYCSSTRMWSELRLFFLSVLFLFTFESKFSRMWSRPSLTIITNREQFLAAFTISKLLMLANHTKACHKQIFWGLSALTLSFAIAK